MAPSPLAFDEGHPIPQELSISGIRDIVRTFADAAKRSLDAGFEILELHTAHIYLAHEFLSPLSNQRSDQYEGSFDNRARCLA